MNMEERLARRLCVMNFGDPDKIMPISGDPFWHNYKDDVEEFLKEMLDPTDAMLDQAHECTVTGCCLVHRDAAGEVWEEMIQAAIEGK